MSVDSAAGAESDSDAEAAAQPGRKHRPNALEMREMKRWVFTTEGFADMVHNKPMASIIRSAFFRLHIEPHVEMWLGALGNDGWRSTNEFRTKILAAALAQRGGFAGSYLGVGEYASICGCCHMHKFCNYVMQVTDAAGKRESYTLGSNCAARLRMVLHVIMLIRAASTDCCAPFAIFGNDFHRIHPAATPEDRFKQLRRWMNNTTRELGAGVHKIDPDEDAKNHAARSEDGSDDGSDLASFLVDDDDDADEKEEDDEVEVASDGVWENEGDEDSLLEEVKDKSRKRPRSLRVRKFVVDTPERVVRRKSTRVAAEKTRQRKRIKTILDD